MTPEVTRILVPPERVQELSKKYNVQHVGDQYYISLNNAQQINELQALLNGTNNAAVGRATVTGAVLEHRTTGTVVGTPIHAYNITFKALADKMNLPNELQAGFKTFLAQKGFAVDDGGEMSIDSTKGAVFNAALKEFANLHKENFIDPNKKFVTFENDSDENAIKGLVDNSAIAADGETTGNRYKINNEAKLNQVLTERVGEVTYDDAAASDAALGAGVTTTTTRRVNTLDVPENLANDKDARKKLEAEARVKYEGFAQDPQNRDAVDLYVAESRYASKIDKREQELMKMETHAGKKTTRNAADIVQLYLDKYSDPKQTKAFNATVEKLMNSTTPEEQKKLLEILQRDLKAYGVNSDTQFSELSSVQKRNAALIAVAEANGISPKDLLRLMAMSDVMGARSDKEIKSDNEYFVKHQAEDYVKRCQAEQEFPKSKIDLDSMGKHGRKLVEACPQLFGNRIDEATYNSEVAKDKNNYYKAEVLNTKTGQYETRFYKFNQDNWKTVMKVACDPTSATEEDRRLLQSLNMTLNEGRTGLEMRLPTADGRMEEIRKIIGNSNDKTGNRELNRWRDLVEQTGLSVDSNPTAAKRMLHVLKNAGIGAGIGMLTGGLSSLFGGVTAYAGQTAAQMVPYAGKTADRTISYSGVTDGGTMNHSFTVPGRDVNWSFATDDASYTEWIEHTTTINGFSETYTAPVTINVDGQTYEGTVHIDPQTYEYTIEYPGQEYSGQIEVEGQEYKGEVEAKGQEYDGHTNNRWSQIRNAGILGGIAGAVRGLTTMNGVNAAGRNTDDVYDFSKLEATDEETQGTFKFEIPQYMSTEVRQGKTAEALGFQPCKLRVRHVADNLNRGETMEDMVAKYYGVQQGSQDYKKIYAYVQQFNELAKFGGMQYPLHNVVNLPDYIPESIVGRKIDRTANPADPQQRLRLSEQDIPTGRGRYNPPAAGHRGEESRYIKGTIRKG